eukprot:CAMPEP_0204855618 /NCGR_PEP_ID=MMETSP1347-20130617/17124_1 /ASSEMBLY_ACC=CAM_ASM_000690 /TAXON_ID=215587 /ORGANISM="Aplanochytrium stocchinoi, Strain GSBS06" /LENGTH=55 /DNA_ID=CAMNT_0052001883 /DNA_START=631 /DNA_END=798 /DNA_ORIENTATION=-
MFTKKPPMEVTNNPLVESSGGSERRSIDSVTTKIAMNIRNMPFMNPDITSNLPYP